MATSLKLWRQKNSRTETRLDKFYQNDHRPPRYPAMVSRSIKRPAQDSGKKSLDLELLGAKLPIPDCWTEAQTAKACEKFHCKDINALYVGVGRADINPRTVIKTLFPEIFKDEVPKKKRAPAFIPKKTDELLITKAKCCKPQENDNVAGYVSGAARGIIAHQDHCKNLKRNKNVSQILSLGWRGADLKIITPITITICGKNRVGLLNDITTLLARENINIRRH